MRPLLFSALVAAGLASLAPAQQPLPQTFRAGVDLVQVDVSVLDKDRHPVRGLTAADFTLFEDGKARPVVAFSAVDLPDRATDPAAASWTREIAADVATNTMPDEGRLVVILMDRTIPDGWPTINAKNIAKAAVHELGPGDLAAVVSTAGVVVPHDFTADRTRLLAAIDGSFPAGELSDEASGVWESLLASLDNPNAGNSGLGALNFSTECHCGACVLDAVARIADAVRDVGPRRKSLLFIGRDLQIETTDFICLDPVRKARAIMFASLDLANLTVHSLDPGGLETLGATASFRGPGYRGRANLVRQGDISVLPDRTGGRTVLNTNNPAMRMPEIFGESDSYYLLGFPPAIADGRRHNISVKVNRRGVDVRTRRGYLAAPPSSAASAVTRPAAAASDAAVALCRVQPAHEGVTLSASVMPLQAPGTRAPVIVIALHVQHQAAASAPRTLSPTPESVEVVTSVLTMGGRMVGTLRQTLRVTPQTGGGGAVSYDVLQRIPAKPGQYELRIGLSNSDRHQTGSVYAFVGVPDYRRAPFAMSDIAIYAPTSGPAAMKDAMADLIPAPPTARRQFARGEQATAFQRFYQGVGAPPVTVFLTAKILDARNRKRYGQEASIPPSEFASGRSADYVCDLPLADLEPGEYLLEIEAKAGAVSSRKDARFTVK